MLSSEADLFSASMALLLLGLPAAAQTITDGDIINQQDRPDAPVRNAAPLTPFGSCGVMPCVIPIKTPNGAPKPSAPVG